MEWFMANGRNHLLKAPEPLTGQCGIQPIIPRDSRPGFKVYDLLVEVPPNACRPCLMVAALSDEVIDEEPMDFARGRGVMPVDEGDIIQLDLPFE
jgi:hypothetical protein